MKKRKILYVIPFAALVLSGCTFQDGIDWFNKSIIEPTKGWIDNIIHPGEEEKEKEKEEEKNKDFTGLSLNDASVTYDGEAHTLELQGNLPEGATATYVDGHEGGTLPGEYEIQILVTCEGYNDQVYSATLTIVASHFEGISFNGETVTYDGAMHSIAVIGDLPAGTEVTYTVSGVTFEGASDVGSYDVVATLHLVGYEDLVLHATLTISSAHFENVAFENSSVHFDDSVHSLAVSGDIPAGTEIAYSVGGQEFEGASAVGVYNVTATLHHVGYEDLALNATLEILENDFADANLEVEDFEVLTNNDLASDWELKFYKDSGWVDPSAASLQIAKNQIIDSGSKTMKMVLTQQGAPFKATRALNEKKTFAKYNGVALDTYVEPFYEGSTCKMQVQFWFKDLPLPAGYEGYKDTYATFTLADDATKGWAHWEIPFTDDTLSICSGKVPVEALAMFGYSFADLTMYLDKVAIIATPNYIDGKNINVYVDNIELLKDEFSSRRVSYHIPAGRYANAEGDNYLAMDLDAGLATGAFLMDGNKVSDLEIEKTATGIIAKDAGYHGAGLTVNASIVDGSLHVDSVSGQLATDYAGLQGLTFDKHANVNVDFTGVKTGSPLKDDNWYQEKWENTWQKVTDKMNVRGDSSDPHCNLTTGYYMDYRYTYTNIEKFGLANKFSVDISNDFASGSYDLKVKIKLIKKSGVEVFVYGDANNYVVVPANTSKWLHIEADNFDTIDVAGIQIVVKSTGSYNQYLYFDNLQLSYEMPEVTPPAPVYTLTDGDFALWNSASNAFKLSISDSLSSAVVTQYGSSDSYAMTVAVNEGEIVVADAAYAGAGLKITGTIGENETITVSNVEGQMAAALSSSLVGKTFKKVDNNISLDFSDGTLDANYTEAHWKESKYANNAWTDYATPTQIRSKVDKFNNKIVNIATNTTTYNFKYTPDHPIGPVNHFEIDLGNYLDGTTGDILYKIALLNSSGGVARYMAGADGNDGFATLAKDTSQGKLLINQSKDFDLTYAYAVRITIKMASGSGYLYMDNLKVSYKAPEPVVPAKTIEDGSYYIWNSNTDAFRMEVSGSQTAAVVSKLGGDSFAMTVEVNGETVTFKDAGYAGAGLTIVANISAENEMTITNVTGQMASMMSGSLLNKVIIHCANMDLDFEDGAGSGAYQGAGWSEQKYTTSWVNVDTVEMNSRKDDNNSKIVNLVASNVTRNFIYDVDLPLGPVNHIDIDLGNFHSASATDVISYKIMIIDKGGTKYYAAGADGNDGFVTMTRDTANGSYLKHFSLDFNLCVGDKLQITTKTSSSNASYFYVDNVHVSYRAPSETVAYKLVDATTWDITASSPEFYAWVWGGNDAGHWEALTLKSDDGNYFDLSLFKGYTGMKIVRVNPESAKKPIVGSTKYGSYTSEQVWNETANIDLNGAGGNVNFSF